MKKLFIFIILLLLFSPLYAPVDAANIDELRDQIKARESKIAELEKEINKYKNEIVTTTAQKHTLKSKIAELEATQRKLEKELEVTQNQIEATELSIEKLGFDINDKKQRIDLNLASLSETIREVHKADQVALIEAVLYYDNVSDLWTLVAALDKVQGKLKDEVYQLKDIKTALEADRDETVAKKEELEDLENNLSSQENVVTYNKKTQATLLAETSSKEEEYQKLLRDKEAQRDAFLKELNNLESQLQIAIDKNKYPTQGTTVFSYPVADGTKVNCWDNGGLNYANCITQYFGDTPFARSGAYNGSGHNGLDFRTFIGEKIYSVGNGTVVATGNTDIGSCKSYGQWVLIEHPNGLSSLYAHLSAISTSAGQTVSTGDIIGYAGATGYATGPHLHLSIIATEGVQVINIGDWYRKSGKPATTACSAANVKIPIAPTEAYLDPLSYM